MGRSGTWTIYSRRWRLHGVRPCRWLPRSRCVFYVVRRNLEFQLTSQPWFGMWVGARWRVGTRLSSPVPEYSYGRPEVKKRTPSVPGVPSVRHRAPVESEILCKLLPLVEHCCVTQYDDGDPREPGWWTLKTMGSAWIIQVKDPDSGSSFQCVAETCDKALETAALLLSCDEAPWAPDPFLKRNKPTKK